MNFKKLIFFFILILLNNRYTFCQANQGNEDVWKKYFSNHVNELDPIEGIYDATISTPRYVDGNFIDQWIFADDFKTNIIIFKIGDKYCLEYISSSKLPESLKLDSSERSSDYFSKTTNPRYFIFHEDDDFDNRTEILYQAGYMNFEIEWGYYRILDKYKRSKPKKTYPKNEEFTNEELIDLARRTKAKSIYKLVKLYPTAEMYSDKKATSSSATGFAISQNGIIATNYHVIENAKKINIRGINGDFSRVFNAKVLLNDKNNDLSVLKIEDSSFKILDSIPYNLVANTSDVGTSIYIYGYPLRATMGDEIKLTNGIVSSKSGFQGDITAYQISASAQPGNSGGPLFDDKGNLIGVVNSKNAQAENATYAIKLVYLTTLLESLTIPIKLSNTNKLKSKPLTEQVKLIKKYVYIIEVEY